MVHEITDIYSAPTRIPRPASELQSRGLDQGVDSLYEICMSHLTKGSTMDAELVLILLPWGSSLIDTIGFYSNVVDVSLLEGIQPPLSGSLRDFIDMRMFIDGEICRECRQISSL